MGSRWTSAAIAVAGVIGLAACGGGPTPGGNPPAPSGRSATHLVGTAWILESYRGSGGTTTPAAAGAAAHLAFEAAGALAGSTGCNRFSGTYTATATALTITPGPTTLVACADPALTTQEHALFDLLAKVSAYSVTGDRLTLTGDGGVTLLTYAAGLSGLTGTSWTATGVNNGAGAVESTAATEQLTASFGAGGAFTGFGGCNHLGGTWRTSGRHGLTITGLTSTLIACGPDIDALENQYVAALGRVAEYAVSGDELTVRDSAGAIQVTYRFAG